jgi:Fe-S-cluster-containing hydrogenase component 2
MGVTWIIIGCSTLGVLVLLLLWIERWPWHLIRRSTIKALGWLGVRYTMTGGAHGVIYGRWGPQYIKLLRFFARRAGPLRKRWLEDGYHGKVLPPDLASAIISIDHEVPLQDLGDQVIPYYRARDIVLNSDTAYVLTDCMCKRDRKDHQGKACSLAKEPYQTCMFIGDPKLCDFLVDHKPNTSIRLTKEEALAKLEEFHQMGLVHNAWFKSCLKDQFYAICNCCPCCCLGFEAMKWGVRQLTPSGYIAQVNGKKCAGCGICAAVCPFHAVEIVVTNGVARSVVNVDKCYGGGVCIEKCPQQARKLVRDRKRNIQPMDVRKLVSKKAG